MNINLCRLFLFMMIDKLHQCECLELDIRGIQTVIYVTVLVTMIDKFISVTAWGWL